MKVQKRALKIEIILSIAILLFCTGCSASSRVLDSIDKGNYVAAGELYSKNVLGNYNLESEVHDGAYTRMDAAIDGYNQGEKTYEAAKAVLETIERSGICDAADVREKYNALDELASSKNSYNFGNEYIANGDYENAIIQYGQVSSEDTNYDAAQLAKADAAGKFKEAVLAEAAANVAVSDYESALRTLQNASRILGSDPDLNSYVEKYQTAYENFKVEQLLQEASALGSQEKYGEAYQLLNNKQSEFPERAEIESAVLEYKTKYKESMIKQAEATLIGERDYHKAFSIMAQALIVLPDESDFIEKQEYYSSFEPIWLGNIEPFMEQDENVGFFGAEGHFYFRDDGVTDNVGNTYENYFYALRSLNAGTNSIVYRLDGNYDTLTGTIVVPDYQKNRDNIGWYKIYCDNKLVFDSGKLGKGVLPIDVNISLTDVVELKIEIHSIAYMSGGAYCGYFADAYLKKSIPQEN